MIVTFSVLLPLFAVTFFLYLEHEKVAVKSCCTLHNIVLGGNPPRFRAKLKVLEGLYKCTGSYRSVESLDIARRNLFDHCN